MVSIPKPPPAINIDPFLPPCPANSGDIPLRAGENPLGQVSDPNVDDAVGEKRAHHEAAQLGERVLDTRFVSESGDVEGHYHLDPWSWYAELTSSAGTLNP
jgi:hypothetical protein